MVWWSGGKGGGVETCSSVQFSFSKIVYFRVIFCAPPVNPLQKVLLYTKFPIGREPITKDPDIKSGSLAKNGCWWPGDWK